MRGQAAVPGPVKCNCGSLTGWLELDFDVELVRSWRKRYGSEVPSPTIDDVTRNPFPVQRPRDRRDSGATHVQGDRAGSRTGREHQ